ncbi:MAG: xylulokinase, partial [Planctomycetes bacterium]|nr:xylulokinase [Planctomycetota bacterium]
MKKYLLVHDLGTTANKACLFDSAGRLAASRLQPLTTSYPDNNRAEQRPADWWQAVCDCTRSLLGESGVEPEAIACVSLCGHNPSAVLIDASGSPLFDSVPIYADLRAVEVADAVFQLLGGYDEFYRITGAGQIPAQYSCFKTAWLLRAFPEKGKNAWKLLNTMDYLAYRLTGRIATDYSQASNTGFLDIATRSWSRRILDALEISPDLLPEIIASTD